MSRAEDFYHAIDMTKANPLPDEVVGLLVAVAKAWLAAEGGIPSEVEANRWSPVCSAAEKVVGIE